MTFADETEKRIADIISRYQDDVIRDMARRVNKMGMSESTKFEAERLIASGAIYDDVTRGMAEVMQITQQEVETMFKEADWDEYIKYYAPNSIVNVAAIAGGIQQILDSKLDNFKRHTINLTGTTATRTQQWFLDACDEAYMKVATGTMSVDSAVIRATNALGGTGLQVQYPSGHVDTVDNAIRRAVRTSVAQTAGAITDKFMQQYSDEYDIVETSAHAGARPRHEPWQGLRFSYSGNNPNYPDFFEETEYGDPLGLMGYNCRHLFFPVKDWETPNYTQAELDEMNNETVEYNGEELKLYDAQQKQRAMERAIRKEKRELIACDEACKVNNTPEAVAEYNKHVDRLERRYAKLDDFLSQTGLMVRAAAEGVMEYDKTSYPLRVLTGVDSRGFFANTKTLTQSEREYMSKLRKNLSNDTKQYNKYMAIIGKENMPTSIDKFQELKYNNKEEWELLKDYTHSRNKGMLSSISTFEDYKHYKKRIEDEIVGITTADGREIKGQTKHFIERLLGTTTIDANGNIKNRDGVEVESVRDALTNPIIIKDETKNKKSVKYMGNDAMVTVNPFTGELIQCNP